MLSSVSRKLCALPARSIGACFAMALAGAALTGGSALAATPDTPFGAVTVKPIGIEGDWGRRMAAAKYDYNGDGANDVFVADRADARVYLLSGDEIAKPSKDTNPLRIFKDPQYKEIGFTGFGTFISVVGDVDGDGKPDLAVGNDRARNAATQVVFVFSGGTGKVIHKLANPGTDPLNDAFSRYGDRVGSAGDITGDGRPEVIVGASGATVNGKHGVGKAYIFNGTTGALKRTLDMPAEDIPTCGQYCQFGLAVQGPGDVDGDGTADQLVNAGYWNNNQGRSYVFSGKTGALIRKLESPEPDANWAFFGFQDAAPRSPGDVNNDGYADVYQASFDQDGSAGGSQGKAWVFSGKEIAGGEAGMPYSTPLYSLDDPTPVKGGQFGWSMDSTDYDKDGTPDLYIGQSPHHGPAGPGGTYVMDGGNGKELKRLELPASCQQDAALGWSIAAPGDLNGDGEPDFVAGAPRFDIPRANDDGSDEGMVFTFVSNPGALRTPCTNEDLGVE